MSQSEEAEAAKLGDGELPESRVLDHLGLVAGMFEELEIGDRIDEHISQDFNEREVSVGQAVKAMVLNGFGFVQQRLYLTPEFFERVPTERLIGEGVRPEHLNEGVLGRALDDLFEYGVTELFRDVAAHAAGKLGLGSRFAHLDATSFSFEGEYDSDEEPTDGVIRIQQGYSRDHRPDLNQAVLDMMVERKAGLPVLMKPLSGNVNDSGSFPELIDRHVDHLQNAHGFDYVVADSALYSSDHVEKLTESGVKFVTRVPETISEAKIESMEPLTGESLTEGYRAEECRSEYGDVEQRWLVVYSEEAEERARESAREKVQKEHEEEAKTFSKLTEREFACREDAEQVLEEFESGLEASEFTEKQVTRATCYTLEESSSPGGEGNRLKETGKEWFVEGTLVPSEERKVRLQKQKSLFIVATNELDDQALSAEEMLEGYKGQVQVERGFRYLKDPQLLADSLYLQKERRIMASLMIMTLCLLVYSALEWRIREGLQAQSLSFPDQKGNPTQRPTARWVFERFLGIHVLFEGQRRLVLNIKDRHRRIITVLGERYAELYASQPS
ncbi:transposase [Salinibacter ruber]|uniref:IS1634 family transposase n=1 Tax=Salinibacter ruber TaxID=146919 RepID=UPI0021679CE2|nr:IS1634 family transposase [Salinibacter ruber]MCS3634867.1 transposase [Salinibacter ruber]MCS3714658.1 transposase [Salinibacter ruber]